MLDTRFECVEDDMLTAQMNHLSRVIFFPFPLVNPSVRIIQYRRGISSPYRGCKLSRKHRSISTLGIQFAFTFLLFCFFFPLCPQDCEWSHSVANVAGRISLRD